MTQKRQKKQNPTLPLGSLPGVKVNSKPPKKPTEKSKFYHIDARGKVLGRLASLVVTILRGKNLPSFRPYIIPDVKVEIENASQIIVTGRKLEQKTYYRHSGYLGHLKSETLKEKMTKDPSKVLWQAIRGMLPSNKLRDQMLKNLKILNGVKNASK